MVISQQLALGMTLAQGAVPIKDQPPVEPLVGPTSTAEAVEPDPSELQSSMARMISEICEAQSTEDLDWRLGEQIAGGPLEDYLEQLFAALPHFSEQDLEVHVDELDPVIREIVSTFLASVELVTSTLGMMEAERPSRTLERPSDLREILYYGVSKPPGLQEILYGESAPPAVRSALYNGQASYLCLLALLDERPRLPWLEAELRRRALDGQRHYLRLILALAREVGVRVPETSPLSSLEPFDLEQADHEGDRQRRSIDAYLDSARTSSDRS